MSNQQAIFQDHTGTSSLAIQLVSFQFSSGVTDTWDLNWLQIKIHVVTPQGRWNRIDPCLLTWEVARLADWLDSVAQDTANEREIDFVEPCLRFEWLDTSDDLIKLRVFLDYEYRPPWAERIKYEDDEYYLDFELPVIEVKAAAQSLRQQLKLLPRR